MKLLLTLLICAAVGTLAAADMSLQRAQELLKAKGYYSGQADGVNSPQTQAALSAYQKDQGLPVSGKLDDKTVAHLNASIEGEALGSVKGAGKEAASSAGSEAKSAGKEAGSSAASETKSAGKEAGSSAASETKSAASETKSAGKEAGSSVASEAKSAWGEIKGVFTGGEKKDAGQKKEKKEKP